MYHCAPLHPKVMKGVCVDRKKQSLYQTPCPSIDRLVQAGMEKWIEQTFRDIRNELEADKVANCEVLETRNYTLAKLTHVKCDH